MVGFVLTVEVGFWLTSLQASVFLETQVVGYAVLHNLEYLEQSLEICKEFIAQSDGIINLVG